MHPLIALATAALLGGPATPGCGDATHARLAHVLPLFSDTTQESAEWRAIAGVQAIASADADVVADPALCVRIHQRVRAWHAQAADTTVFGDDSVHALRLGPYYAAVVDYPPPPGYGTTGWSTLLILAPDDLRVLASALL